jgi:hypothetical protein
MVTIQPWPQTPRWREPDSLRLPGMTIETYRSLTST